MGLKEGFARGVERVLREELYKGFDVMWSEWWGSDDHSCGREALECVRYRVQN